jgi:hypothetical protein
MTKVKAWGIRTQRGAIIAMAFSSREKAESYSAPALGDKIVRVEIREVLKTSDKDSVKG